MYIDPGFGSTIFQLLLAGILTVGVLIRVFWNKIKEIFTGKNNVSKENEKPIEQ